MAGYYGFFSSKHHKEPDPTASHQSSRFQVSRVFPGNPFVPDHAVGSPSGGPRRRSSVPNQKANPGAITSYPRTNARGKSCYVNARAMNGGLGFHPSAMGTDYSSSSTGTTGSSSSSSSSYSLWNPIPLPSQAPQSSYTMDPQGFSDNAIAHSQQHSGSSRTASVRDRDRGLSLRAVDLQNQQQWGGSLRVFRETGPFAKSLQHHLSRETLPHIDHYSLGMQYHNAKMRPSLDDLLNADGQSPTQFAQEANYKDHPTEGIKFGWIQGVLIRCLLNIWGVMLFLRLSWVVAEAGIGQAILIVLLATAVTSLTTLSMSAISTNGQIKAGGTYYMISRSLGPEFGAAIGIVFALANAVAVSLHTVGFCESLNDLLESMGVKIIDNAENDIRITGSITLVVLTMIVSVGMEWEAKAQAVLMAILSVSLANFFAGSIMGPQEGEVGKGYLGFSTELLSENFYSDYRPTDGVQYNFFSVFAVFFPAATGILAGANISGDLKDPSKAIPKGTLLAIIITSLSYIVFAVIAGASVLRDASGNETDIIDGVLVSNCTSDFSCEWGLHNSFQVMELVSAFGPLNYAGCFAATLSSALACFVSAPKVFQALCNDHLFPYLDFFGKGYGKNNEPLRAYALTFVIALGFILIAKLDVIAPLISSFFLSSYALVNFSTFHIDLVQPVSWRPTFKYYNRWLSLFGCFLSVVSMFLCSWPTALITLILVVSLVLIVKYRRPQVNWGSSPQVQAYKTALTTVHQLNNAEDHVKTYTPQILILTGPPYTRPSLVDFGYLLCKKNSMLMCGDIVEKRRTHKERAAQSQKANRWLKAHKVKAFYNSIDNTSFSDGSTALLQASGIGKMKPNIVLFGYKASWRTADKISLDQYYDAIHSSFDMHVAVTVLRVPEGLNFSGVVAEYDPPECHASNNTVQGSDNKAFAKSEEDLRAPHVALETQLSQTSSIATLSDVTPAKSTSELHKMQRKMKQQSKIIFKDPAGNDLDKEVLDSIYRFRMKQKKGTIDVWWLYDDGGLTMLLPHIISTRSNWANSKLRVFCLAEKDDSHKEKSNMRALLAKFRIPVSDVVVVSDITNVPSDATKAWFETMVKEFLKKNEGDDTKPIIQESELIASKEKSYRHMRLRELLLEHSTDANLVVMTLPFPRKKSVPAPLYMAWLETLTSNMPPFLLVRGNQTSVLTFYS